MPNVPPGPTRREFLLAMPAVGAAMVAGPARGDATFPAKDWPHSPPEAAGLKPEALNELSRVMGGHGVVVRDGRIAHEWGNPSRRSDWYSSVKPVFSTLLWFAVHESRVSSVDETVSRWGWDLSDKDRPMTFRHLADMTSGYARPEPPGAAFSYNDFAIQLYQRTLFDRVFQQDPTAAMLSESRLGPLSFQDDPQFNKRRRLIASPRDFARLGWFWLNRGAWHGSNLLPSRFFEEYLRPDVPIDLPLTRRADTDDYLQIGSFGGGSDHFTQLGPGVYGFNFWHNAPTPSHPSRPLLPSAPAAAHFTIGFGGNCLTFWPTERLVLACSAGNWGKLDPPKSGAHAFDSLMGLVRSSVVA